MLSPSEQRVLEEFRHFLMTPGKMLCFSGPNLDRFAADLNRMVDKKLLVRESFKGAFSLTKAGYAVMKSSTSMTDG